VGAALPVGRVEPLANGGTLITLAQPQQIDRLRFTVEAITGRWFSGEVAALTEIEVIGMATTVSAPPLVAQDEQIFLPTVLR